MWTRSGHLDSEGLEREDVGGVHAVEVRLHLRDPRPAGRRRHRRRDGRRKQQQRQVRAGEHPEGRPVAAEQSKQARRSRTVSQSETHGEPEWNIITHSRDRRNIQKNICLGARRRKNKGNKPAGLHEGRHGGVLEAGDVLDGEVDEEAHDAGDDPDGEAEGPLEHHVPDLVRLGPRPPVLVEQVVLDDPATQVKFSMKLGRYVDENAKRVREET